MKSSFKLFPMIDAFFLRTPYYKAKSRIEPLKYDFSFVILPKAKRMSPFFSREAFSLTEYC